MVSSSSSSRGDVLYLLLLLCFCFLHGQLMQGCNGAAAADAVRVQGYNESADDDDAVRVQGYNESAAAAAWGSAKATWYGAPNGAGPADNGGACGFKNVNKYPFMGMTSCGNQPLYKGGKGCGSCYKVRCTRHHACSGNAQTVAITDMNYFPLSLYHFDLSGTAFGRLAKPGRADELRRAGIIDVQFARVPCEFPGLKVGFHVEEGSSPVYLAVLVEYENGDGDVAQVELREAGAAARWTAMRESWGSVWRLDSNHRLRAPFSIRIRSDSGKTLMAPNVIPLNWRPNTLYRSFVQYSS